MVVVVVVDVLFCLVSIHVGTSYGYVNDEVLIMTQPLIFNP